MTAGPNLCFMIKRASGMAAKGTCKCAVPSWYFGDKRDGYLIGWRSRLFLRHTRRTAQSSGLFASCLNFAQLIARGSTTRALFSFLSTQPPLFPLFYATNLHDDSHLDHVWHKRSFSLAFFAGVLFCLALERFFCFIRLQRRYRMGGRGAGAVQMGD